MRRSIPCIAGIGTFFLAALPALAQPAPAFRVQCGELRETLARLGSQAEEQYTVADVVGTLTAVHHDGTLGYMVTCEAPDPRVLCITYEINDYKVGDKVSLTGALNVLDDNHIRLDPCLHYPHEAEQLELK